MQIKGLIVYSLKEDSYFEVGFYIWNGNKKITYIQNDSRIPNNGFSLNGNNIELGEKLSKATIIKQGIQDLSFAFIVRLSGNVQKKGTVQQSMITYC